MGLIDADALSEGIELHRQSTNQKYETDRQWAVGYNAGLDRALYSIAYAKTTITPPPNGPLTLEELRKMDGEPVYVHWVRRNWQMDGEWAFVCLKWQGCKIANGGAVFFDRYGEWWIA